MRVLSAAKRHQETSGHQYQVSISSQPLTQQSLATNAAPVAHPDLPLPPLNNDASPPELSAHPSIVHDYGGLDLSSLDTGGGIPMSQEEVTGMREYFDISMEARLRHDMFLEDFDMPGLDAGEPDDDLFDKEEGLWRLQMGRENVLTTYHR